MRNLSITLRLALWYALFLLLAAALMWLAFSRAVDGVTRSFYRETLKSASALARDEIYMTEDGLDFDARLSELDHADVSFYEQNGDLLYGRARLDTPFLPGAYREVEDEDGGKWAVYDETISVEGFAEVILRAYMDTGAAERMTGGLSRAIAWILPSMLALAAGGGYAISKRALRPVNRIISTAESIADAGDLDKRIGPTGAQDELYRLSCVFDAMLARLGAAFSREARFTSDASHEMRTPVAAILAQTEAALMAGASEDEKTEALTRVQASARTLSGLINRLLLLARMDAGRLKMAFEDIDLAEIARGAAQDASERFHERGIRVRVNPPPFTLPARGDQTMLTRLFLNLADNACRHSPDGANVEISLARCGNTARAVVADEGEGIDDASLPHVFERFYRADGARAGGGEGLGLSIALAVARAHGGDIRAESEKGRGARFIVSLPIA